MADNSGAQAGTGPQSPFEEVTDPDTVRDVFNVILKHRAVLTVWLKDRTLQFDVKMAAVTRDHLFFDLPHEIGTETWDNAYSAHVNNGDGYIFGTAQIVKTVFFLKMTIDAREDRTIKIYKPAKVFKLQRRANMRIRLSFVKQQFLRFEDPEKAGNFFSYRMMDLSLGGSAIAAKPTEKDRFKIGTIIERVQFTVLGLSIECDAVVRHIMESKDEASTPILKVGLEFLKFSAEYQQVVARFVSQETRNIFSTLA